MINPCITSTSVCNTYKYLPITGHRNQVVAFSRSLCYLTTVSFVRLQVGLLEYTDDGELVPTSVVPLIDGGTEGFKGNVRVILPGMSACIECTLDLYPPQVCLRSSTSSTV